MFSITRNCISSSWFSSFSMFPYVEWFDSTDFTKVKFNCLYYSTPWNIWRSYCSMTVGIFVPLPSLSYEEGLEPCWVLFLVSMGHLGAVENLVWRILARQSYDVTSRQLFVTPLLYVHLLIESVEIFLRKLFGSVIETFLDTLREFFTIAGKSCRIWSL